MANKTCTAKMTLTYTDGDNSTKVSTTTVAAPYQALSEGLLDVPDGTLDAIEFEIPFGTIAKATVLEVMNRSGADMTLQLNGSADLIDVPNGAALCIAAAALPGDNELTAASLFTTGVTSGAGTIAYKVFGDPV